MFFDQLSARYEVLRADPDTWSEIEAERTHAKCEDVKSISEQRLIGRLGAVDEEIMFQAARTLRFLLDL